MAWQDVYTQSQFRQLVRQLVYGPPRLSAAKAAEHIGHGVTKNMVIRVMQWLKANAQATVFPDSIWPSVPLFGDRDNSPAAEAPVHITRVKDWQCRAPLWADTAAPRQTAAEDLMFCGKRSLDGSHYCSEHHAIFYPPELQTKRRRPREQEVKDNSYLFE